MPTDFGAMSDEALVHHELGLEHEMLLLSMAASVGKLSDTSALKRLRREIARSRTEARRREIAGGLLKDALRNRFRANFKPGRKESLGSGGFLSEVATKFE